jgi:hypothetical protein
MRCWSLRAEGVQLGGDAGSLSRADPPEDFCCLPQATINQYLAAGLIDELRLHIVPLTLGAGTRLFEGVSSLKLEQVESRAASSVTHVTYRVLS